MWWRWRYSGSTEKNWSLHLHLPNLPYNFPMKNWWKAASNLLLTSITSIEDNRTSFHHIVMSYHGQLCMLVNVSVCFCFKNVWELLVMFGWLIWSRWRLHFDFRVTIYLWLLFIVGCWYIIALWMDAVFCWM